MMGHSDTWVNASCTAITHVALTGPGDDPDTVVWSVVDQPVTNEFRSALLLPAIVGNPGASAAYETEHELARLGRPYALMEESRVRQFEPESPDRWTGDWGPSTTTMTLGHLPTDVLSALEGCRAGSSVHIWAPVESGVEFIEDVERPVMLLVLWRVFRVEIDSYALHGMDGGAAIITATMGPERNIRLGPSVTELTPLTGHAVYTMALVDGGPDVG